MARDDHTRSIPNGKPPRLALPLTDGRLPPPTVDAEWVEEPPRHLRDYLRVLRVHRWLALACFVATLAVTILVTMLVPRRYTASTRLQVARQSPIQLRLADNVLRLDDGDNGRSATEVFLATQVAALQSRDLAERVIGTRGLATDATFLYPASDQIGPPAATGTL